MIQMTAETRILLSTKAADFRKGIDGLVAVCQQELTKDPRSGALYVFINRSKTMIRILSFDGTGYWLCHKRLSKSKFQGWPSGNAPINTLEAKQLQLLIRGKHPLAHADWKKCA